MLKNVRFTRHHSPHNAGEVAGFDEKTAANLIERGIAVAFERGDPEPQPEPAPKAESDPKTDGSAKKS